MKKKILWTLFSVCFLALIAFYTKNYLEYYKPYRGIQNPSLTNPATVPSTTIPVEETADTPVAVPEKETESSQPEQVVESITVVEIAEKDTAWQKAYEKGCELVKKNDLKKATFYFTNSLGKNPGNMQVISAYVDVLMKLKDAAGITQTAYEYLNVAEVFLQGQIVNVSENDIETILTMIQNVADQKQKLEDAMDELVETTETAEETIEEDPLIETLNSLTAAMDEQKGFVRQSLDNNFLDIASYQIQECEQIMRGLIGIMPKLDKEHQDSIAQIYSDLKNLSDEVIDKKSEVVWTKYLAEHESFMKSLGEVKINDNPVPVKENEEGPCQLQIAKIQKQIMVLQQIMPNLSPKYLGDITQGTDKNTAAGRLREMQERLQKVIFLQQQSYNIWALDQIKNGLQICHDAEGTIANGKAGTAKIDEALVNYLGAIDLQYLTNEVSRCYQEVQNKYLADNQLYKVEDGNDFSKPGSKLHALKGMSEKTRVKLSQF